MNEFGMHPISHLEDYDIKIGQNVLILTPPKNNSDYTYKEGIISRIFKSNHEPEKPDLRSKYYKTKIRYYLKALLKDECDKCEFYVLVENNRHERKIDRKYLYTLEERSILEKDIYYLNLIHQFKKNQEKELDLFIKEKCSNWDPDFRKTRMKDKGGRKMGLVKRICPRCGQEYLDFPAISRKDNKTEICPTCGMAEALLPLTNEPDVKWVKEIEK